MELCILAKIWVLMLYFKNLKMLQLQGLIFVLKCSQRNYMESWLIFHQEVMEISRLTWHFKMKCKEK
jgi:hypothetical protein